MGRGHDRETFAEVVARTTAEPVVARRAPAGPSSDGTAWTDLDGVEYFLVARKLDPVRAQKLVRAGAQVVYDSCGCGGDCGLDWLTAAELADLARAEPPRVGFRKKTWGRLAEWRSDAGDVLIEAAVNVRWGARIDG